MIEGVDPLEMAFKYYGVSPIVLFELDIPEDIPYGALDFLYALGWADRSGDCNLDLQELWFRRLINPLNAVLNSSMEPSLTSI